MKIPFRYVLLLLTFHVSSSENEDYTQHIQKFFSCVDELQILDITYCDDVIDCIDGSDEQHADESNDAYNHINDTVKCNNELNELNLTCSLPRQQLCDGTIKCKGLSPCDVYCDNYYICQNSNTCVKRSTVCDKDTCKGCPEDNEMERGVGFKCKRFGKMCVLPQQLLFDDVTDCDGGLDRCYKNTTTEEDYTYDVRLNTFYEFDEKLCFECFDGNMIIPRSRVCDGMVDCSDLSDECLCQMKKPSICSLLHLEAESFKENVETTSNMTRHHSPMTCNYGDIQCNNGHCIGRHEVCNGIADCGVYYEDEREDFCNVSIRCDQTKSAKILAEVGTKCVCEGNQDRCQNIVAGLCDDKMECWNGDDECSALCSYFGSKYGINYCPRMSPKLKKILYSCTTSYALRGTIRYTYMPTEYTSILHTGHCDGYLLCDVGWEDETNCPGRTPCENATKGRVSFIEEEICDGIVHCKLKTDEKNCSSRFECPAYGGTRISIDKNLRCDYYIACDKAEDELNCNDSRFYCEDGKMPIFVRKEQIFDGIPDCEDWSDECPSNMSLRKENIFSSRYELIANPVLRTFIWIMGFAALIGNMAVIISECKDLYALKNKIGGIFANRCLILNLAISDLLMGIYLITLAAVGIQFQGNYCSNELNWRSSNKCTALGIISTISAEASVFSLLAMTAIRLFSVKKPIKAMQTPKKQIVIIILAACWFISLLLALMPIAPSLTDVFMEEIFFKNNPLVSGNTTSLKDFHKTLKEFAAFDNASDITKKDVIEIPSMSWRELEVLSKKFTHSKYLDPLYFGYYSTHSVCLPKFFLTTSDKAWRFSFIVNLINFFSFIFVMVSYLVIMYESTHRPQLGQSNGPKDAEYKRLAISSALERKILRLIVTDFCCWMPICLMAFINLSGIKVPDAAYAFSAIILLPINSSLNPILYSNVTEIIGQSFKKIPSKFVSNATTSGDTSTTRI